MNYRIELRNINGDIIHTESIVFEKNFNYMILDYFGNIDDGFTEFEGDKKDIKSIDIVGYDDDYKETMESLEIEDIEPSMLSREMDEYYEEEE